MDITWTKIFEYPTITSRVEMGNVGLSNFAEIKVSLARTKWLVNIVLVDLEQRLGDKLIL